jgi:ferritin-like metal-binding protein YciE
MVFTASLDTKRFVMDNMNDLRSLLLHDLQDLYSAEEQIIAAMPTMIDNASDPRLKQALEQHLRVTENQRERLRRVQQALGTETGTGDSGGMIANLFGMGKTCEGMKGIIQENTKTMKEDMSPAVRDAAIIAGAQKVEHYEICGYGTARTYAQQLGLTEVARLLQETLDEEHQADEILTSMAVADVNQRAEVGTR